MVRTPAIQIHRDQMRSYAKPGLVKLAEPLAQVARVNPKRLMLINWYRLCSHPDERGDSYRILERIATHAFLQPGSRIHTVEPVTVPRLDSSNYTTLTDATDSIVKYSAAVYPVTLDEQAQNPITEVLGTPYDANPFSEGYVALRGIEEIIDWHKKSGR